MHSKTLKELTEAKIAQGVESFKYYLSQGIDRMVAREMVLSSSCLGALPAILDAL